jgi:Spy/CpxP family protein refolding chaperone
MNKIAKLGLIAALIAGPAFAQTESAAAPEAAAPAAAAAEPTRDEVMAEMNALQDAVREGKREVVAKQMQLTDAEAAKFWPVYDAHQEALAGFNKRRMDNIYSYAQAWNAGPIDDATAEPLARAALALEQDEAAQLEKTFDKAMKAVGASKAVRYLQMESKIRALVRFDQAAQVPLAQ